MTIKNFFDSAKQKNVAIITHAGCDVDAFASAGALYLLFSQKSKVSILVPEHINLSAKALAKNMNIPYSLNYTNLKKFDLVVVVDTNSLSMVGDFGPELKSFDKPLLVIDHHEVVKDQIAFGKNLILNKKAVSSTEILYHEFLKSKIKITPKMATLIACGIITDSAEFLIATHETFKIMADLMRISSRSYAELRSLLKIKEDISEKIAKLKAARRSTIYKSFEHLLVSAEVGAHEGDAAMALIALGADVAFVGSEDNNQITISSRASFSFIKKYNFDLTLHVFKELEKEFGGNAGGHAGAASYKGTGVLIDPLLKKCIILTHNFLISKMKKVAPLKEYN